MEQQANLAEQLECFEFLDLSDVDVGERDQLATTLYARDESEEAADRDRGEGHGGQTDVGEREELNSQSDTAEAQVAYWRNQQQGRVSSYSHHRKGRGGAFGLKQQQQHNQFLERRDLVFIGGSGHEQQEEQLNNNGSVVDSRPVSRTESVLTDISSSYLSSSASSLHVPNNAPQYPASVTSPPPLVNNGSALSAPPLHQATAYVAGTILPLHNQQPPPSTAPVAHHVRPHPQQPRHVNPSSVAHSAAELLSNVCAATVGQQQQQQQPMVVVAGGGAVTGGSGGGVFGRNGLPVVVPGPPPHPHGPLIRGNFVPRLLAPLQAGGGFSSGGAGGSLPLYAIVKPQSQQPHQQQQRPIVGGPPVHVCIGGGAPHCPPAKLGPATAPVNGGTGSVNSIDFGGGYAGGISFDSGNVSSVTGSSRPGSDSVDVTDADASTSSSTLTTSEIIERGEVLLLQHQQPPLHHPQHGEHGAAGGVVVEPLLIRQQQAGGPQFMPEDYQKTHLLYQGEMSQQQHQQAQGGGGNNSNNNNSNTNNNHGNGVPQQAAQPYHHHYHSGAGQQQQQHHHQQPATAFIPAHSGGHMYHMLPHTLSSNVFVGNMTANVNVMSHPFIPTAAASAVASAAGGQPTAYIEMPQQQQHQVAGSGGTPGMIHGGGHEMVQQQQGPMQQHQPSHHQSQGGGHMMGSGTRGRGRGGRRGGNMGSHRREYGGGRMHHQGQGHLQHMQAQHHQTQQPQQQNTAQVHQQSNQAGNQQQQNSAQQQQQQQQPEMMTQIIDPQQMMNPAWFYYAPAPYAGYYNQMPPGHHQVAAAATQHATGHPIYHVPMYGHPMMSGYPQGMVMYPSGAAPPQGVVQSGGGGPNSIITSEYAGYVSGGDGAAKGNFVQAAIPVVTAGDETQQQYEAQQQQQQTPPQQGGGEQMVVQQGGGAVPTQIWTPSGGGNQSGPLPVDYQEIVVIDPQQQQQMQITGDPMEEYSNAVIVDQGYMDQQQQQTPTHVHHTLNPNVANFMPLKQQQEMTEQQQNGDQGMQQQQQVQMEVLVQQQPPQPGGFEHRHVSQQPQQTLAYDMAGQPIVVNEQGEVAYLATNVEAVDVLAPQEYNQQQVVVAEPPQGGELQQPNSVVYTNMSNFNMNSPKVPQVPPMTPIVQNINNVASTATPPSQSTGNVVRAVEPIVELQHQGSVSDVVDQTVDAYMSTMVEEKMTMAPAQGTSHHHSKAWPQKTSPQQSQAPPHDTNNNVSAAAVQQQQQKKVVSTTSVAVTAVPGRSPMASPKVRHEPVSAESASVNGAAPKADLPPVVQKANAILQTDVVPQQQQKKLETNTVSVTATPAAINGGAGEKPQQQVTTVPAPSSWASLFASSQKSTAPDNSNGPVVGSKKPVAKVLPFEGTQVQAPTTNSAGTLSYSAASSMGLSSPKATATTAPSASVASVIEEDNSNTSAADRRGFKLGEFLSKYQIDNTNVSLNPRGLTNRSNYCYINAIVQALVACPPFYHVMKQIKQEAPGFKEKSTTPIIDAMVDLVNEFTPLTQAVRINRREKGPKGKEEIELNCLPPFEPTVIHKILNSRGNGFKVEGRQEDAEEFLSYLLNGLNDEMMELIKMVEKPIQNGVETPNGGEPVNDEGDDWQVIVNNRNKGTVTRTTDFGRTPISDIFRGQSRSRLQREGDHSTDVIQPFFTLQLDIEKVSSVKEALEMLVVKDQLEGVTCTKTNQEVAAWQQYTLEKLPMVLVLHLKLFDYNMGGCTKILKTVSFPIELKIDTKILSSKKYQAKQKQYKLFAIVYHDGKEASKGHYITDVYNVAYSSWIRYDDSMVRPVREHQVLHPKAPRVPYLLYYRRCDTIAGSTQAGHLAGGGGEQQQAQQPATSIERGTTTHSSRSSTSGGGAR